MRDWLPTAATVSFCKCIHDSVNIDVKKFYTNLGESPEDYLPPEALCEDQQAEGEEDDVVPD